LKTDDTDIFMELVWVLELLLFLLLFQWYEGLVISHLVVNGSHVSNQVYGWVLMLFSTHTEFLTSLQWKNTYN